MMRSFLLAVLIIPATAADGPMPADAYRALMKRLAVKKTGSQVPGLDLAKELKLPAARPYMTHYVALSRSDAEGVEHSFGKSKELGDHLLVRRAKDRQWYLRADGALVYVGGAHYRHRGDSVQPLDEAAGRTMLAEELAFWTKEAAAPQGEKP